MKNKLYCLNLVISQVQRLFVFTFSFLFLSATISFAQSEKFATEIKKEDAKADASADLEAHAKLDKHPNAKDVHYFKMGNLANVQKNGLFSFPSPVTGKIIHAMTKRLEYRSEKDYLWYGTVSDTSLKGDMMLISEKGKIYGRLNYNDENYQIYGVGTGISAFVPTLVSKFERFCENPPAGTGDKVPTEVTVRTTDATEGYCANPNRILVVYTQAAIAYDPNIAQTANTGYKILINTLQIVLDLLVQIWN